MKWEEIKIKFPIAFNKLIASTVPRDSISALNVDAYIKWLDSGFYFRSLYDFFDSFDIFVEILHNESSPHEDKFLSVLQFENNVLNKGDVYKTRKEAEEFAFELAFKLLNEKV